MIFKQNVIDKKGQKMTDSVKDRTLYAKQCGLPIEQIICHAVSDYKEATQRPEFAENYGGIDNFKNELFSLIDEWTNQN